MIGRILCPSHQSKNNTRLPSTLDLLLAHVCGGSVVPGCSGGAVTLWDVEMEKAAPSGAEAGAAKAESGEWRHLKTFRTRRTAVCTVKFTQRNLLQCGGGTAPDPS